MSLKMEYHSKWNVTQKGMLLTLEYHSNWNVTQIGMLPYLECHSRDRLHSETMDFLILRTALHRTFYLKSNI